MPRTIFFAAVILFATLVAPPAHATAWFVIGETRPFHGDSYVVAIDDPQLIEDARAILRGDPGVGRIVTAAIAPGADGLNRNALGTRARDWSWHVVDVIGFADFAIELCDGWPTFVESDVQGWIANTGGRICFWSYTVVQELPSPNAYAIGEVLDGAWYNPATPGQGVMLDVLSEQRQVFAGWFTYDYRSGNAPGTPFWISAQGPATTARPTLAVTSTTGGAFNGTHPVQNRNVGSLTLEFADCNHGTMTWTLEDGGSGSAPLERVAPRTDCMP